MYITYILQLNTLYNMHTLFRSCLGISHASSLKYSEVGDKILRIANMHNDFSLFIYNMHIQPWTNNMQ